MAKNANFKKDDVKQAWEGDSEFPLVCETCLGDNPYVRMTKEPFGKKCQVCETPFTVFSWQAGTKGRMKRVEICRACAQAKNVCQVCIYDLQYGLPVKVRDKVLRETGGSSNPALTMVPHSTANRAWFSAQQQRLLEQGQSSASSDNNALAHAKLSDMAQMDPRYERNLPKLCSFFARGECDRGSNCPFRHEMPRDRNDPMSKQNTKDRFYGTSDPVANKILGRKRRQEEVSEKRDEHDGYEKARATVYLRFQRNNTDTYSSEQPPVYPVLTEMDVRDQFYAFGEILSVRVQPDRGQAFVEYSLPEAAELAIASMNRKELLGRTIFTAWARAPKRGEQEGGAAGNNEGSNSTRGDSSLIPVVVRPVAPPGGFVSKKAALTSEHKGLLPAVKLPPEVAAIAAARKQKIVESNSNTSSSSNNVPRPSRGGAGGVPRPDAGAQVYPSTDPNRLGSKTSSA